MKTKKKNLLENRSSSATKGAPPWLDPLIMVDPNRANLKFTKEIVCLKNAVRNTPRTQLPKQLRRKTKGQFRAMETIIITIIITILFITGYVIYNNISSANFENKKMELEKARMSALNILISNIPELKCSTLSIKEVACIDKYKAEAFIELSDDEAFSLYEELFGNTVIELRIVHLEPYGNDTLVLYDNPLENFTSATPVFNPVSFYDPVSKKAEFAILKTTFYER